MFYILIGMLVYSMHVSKLIELCSKRVIFFLMYIECMFKRKTVNIQDEHIAVTAPKALWTEWERSRIILSLKLQGSFS